MPQKEAKTKLLSNNFVWFFFPVFPRAVGLYWLALLASGHNKGAGAVSKTWFGGGHNPDPPMPKYDPLKSKTKLACKKHKCPRSGCIGV